MQELYFLLFRHLAANPAQKHGMAGFHAMGMLAFWLSAKKHLQRRHRKGVVENLISMFRQLIECCRSLLFP